MYRASLILPYAAEDADREKPIGYDMEVAVMLCLAEAKRKKKGILGSSPETISFISKLYYPLWAIPWQKASLIIDGLGFFHYTVVHMKTPDVEVFTEDIKRNTTVRGLYHTALKSHAQTFENFTASDTIPMEAVIGDKRLLSAISEYVALGAARKEKMMESFVLTPPRLNKKTAVEKAKRVIGCRSQIQSEVKGLEYSINVLTGETGLHEQKILSEIEQTKGRYENEILQLRPSVEKKIERFTKERDSKIERVAKATDKELKAMLKKKGRYELELRKLERNIEDYQQRRENRKRKNDKRGVSRWDRRIKACRKKISETEKQIHGVSRLIERAHQQLEVEVEKLKESYQNMIHQERKRISDLEASRDSETAAKREEIRKLQLETSTIIDLIKRLREQKMTHASNLEELTIPWRPREVTLICVPFYLVRYETNTRARYDVHPPVVAEDYEGIIKKVRKAVWSFSLGSRINLLLHSRYEALEEMLTSIFAEKLKEDRALEKVVRGLGYSNNILRIPDLRERLTKGMEKLEKKGWVNSEDKDTILNAYTTSAKPS